MLVENLKNIGRKAYIQVGGLDVEVVIKDFKNSYGKNRWLVVPTSGRGEVWVEAFYDLHD